MSDVRESFCQVTKDARGHSIARLVGAEGPKGGLVEVARSTPLHDETSVVTKLANVFRRVTQRLDVGDALVPVNGKNVPFAGESIDVERNSDGTGQCFHVLPGDVRSAPYTLKP